MKTASLELPNPAPGRPWLRRFGAGLIAGAADDDPSGIATYTQAGAQYGYATLWTAALTLPLMIAIQTVSAYVARVTGRGLAANMRRVLPAPLVAALIGLLLFAAGIVGTGLLAVPVLAGSAAYAVSEICKLRTGLGRRPGEAWAFYLILGATTLFGAALDLLPVAPMRMLFWAAVINGAIAMPIMAAVMWIACRPDTMGSFVVRGPLRWCGWLATLAMALAGLASLF